MDNMDFMSHDTSGPPAHANNMPQPSAEWLAHSAFVPHWHQSGASMYSQYDSTNPAFTNSYAPIQSGPYSMANVSSGRLSNSMSQYQLPAGIWPPTSLPQQPNAPQPLPFGLIPGTNEHHTHIARGSSATPVIAHSPHAFAPNPATSNRQLLPGTVNPQLNANARVNQHSQNSTLLSPEAPPFSLQARNLNQAYQPPYRSVQNRSRSSQTHQRTQSTPALNQNTTDRISQPSFSERRRLEHMRGRRSVGTRFSASDSQSETARTSSGSLLIYPSGRRQVTMNHTGTLEEAETRRLQLLRGALQSRYVVSKAALQSLQAVKVKDLPESDRTCMICYNDYETDSPEGVSEMPIRLPKCKHVFGNHCIRKWFQDSDSCPYCRDKLQSEPKHYPSSTRAFLDMMRIRGWSAGSEVAEDFYRRIMNGEDVQAIVRLARPATERRPAQDEQHDESSRRSRNRRASSSSVDQEPFSPLRSPEMTGHGATRPRTTPNSSGAVSPTQAGAGSTPWILMGPGSSGSMQQNVPFRYQSPARPSPSTTARQPGSAAQPSSRHQQAYTRHAASSSAIPNPLRQGNQVSQILHLDSPDRPLGDFLEEFYSSEDESA